MKLWVKCLCSSRKSTITGSDEHDGAGHQQAVVGLRTGRARRSRARPAACSCPRSSARRAATGARSRPAGTVRIASAASAGAESGSTTLPEEEELARAVDAAGLEQLVRDAEHELAHQEDAERRRPPRAGSPPQRCVDEPELAIRTKSGTSVTLARHEQRRRARAGRAGRGPRSGAWPARSRSSSRRRGSRP